MSWGHALELLALASSIVCALVCIGGYYSGKRKSNALGAPSLQTRRAVYQEHAHAVGNMRGCR